MSRKHYVAFANAIKSQMDRHPNDDVIDASARITINDLANDMCAIFKLDNPNFDLHRFKVAAGLI